MRIPPWPCSSNWKTSTACDCSFRRILHTPCVVMASRSPAACQQHDRALRTQPRAFKESCSKVDAQVSVPRPAAAPDEPGYLARLELLEAPKDATPVAEAHNDLRHSQQERLYPEFLELSFVLEKAFVVLDAGRCLQLYPVDGLFGVLGLLIPYWERIRSCSGV